MTEESTFNQRLMENSKIAIIGTIWISLVVICSVFSIITILQMITGLHPIPTWLCIALAIGSGGTLIVFYTYLQGI
jgi:hypothetical protein